MKATKIISACAVLVALASCSNDHVISQPGAEDTPIRIQANVGAVTTKAAHDIQSQNFNDGQTVNVYIYEHTTGAELYKYGSSSDGYVPCTVNSNKLNPTGGVTLFYPANGNGIDVYGVYPNTVIENTSSQNFEVKNDQSLENDYMLSDLMFADPVSDHKKTDGDVSLVFKHKLSKVIVKLQKGSGLNASDIDGATVKITNTIRQCTIASVGKSGMGNVAVTSDAASPITVGTWNSSTTPNGIAAIVVPQGVTANSQLFEVELTNNAVYRYYIPSTGNVTFSPEKVYTYTLTLTTAGINVTSSITNWTDDTSNLPNSGNGDATL